MKREFSFFYIKRVYVLLSMLLSFFLNQSFNKPPGKCHLRSGIRCFWLYPPDRITNSNFEKEESQKTDNVPSISEYMNSMVLRYHSLAFQTSVFHSVVVSNPRFAVKDLYSKIRKHVRLLISIKNCQTSQVLPSESPVTLVPTLSLHQEKLSRLSLA